MSINILGISGSLRRDSLNRALLRAAGSLLPSGADLEVADISDLPLYNWDVEQELGFPEPVIRFRSQIAAADGLLISTPEYNNSIPGPLKNALDWASRGGQDSPLNQKTGGDHGCRRSSRFGACADASALRSASQ